MILCLVQYGSRGSSSYFSRLGIGYNDMGYSLRWNMGKKKHEHEQSDFSPDPSNLDPIWKHLQGSLHV